MASIAILIAWGVPVLLGDRSYLVVIVDIRRLIVVTRSDGRDIFRVAIGGR